MMRTPLHRLIRAAGIAAAVIAWTLGLAWAVVAAAVGG